MPNWLDAIPNLTPYPISGVLGVPGVPEPQTPQKSAGFAGTPDGNTTSAQMFRGVPADPPKKHGNPPFSGRENREHREHLSEQQAKAILRDWHSWLSGLDPLAPPVEFDAGRWGQLVDDACWIYQGFASRAVRDGWSALDLFGVLPARPGWGGLVDRLRSARDLNMTSDLAACTQLGLPDRLCRGGGDDLAGAGCVPLWGYDADWVMVMPDRSGQPQRRRHSANP